MNELNGTIHGIVSEEGTAKVDNEVVLLDHETLSILARTRTDKFGGYMFNNLDPDKTDYMMYTVDNDGAQPKNALIKDYVQPVKGNNGAIGGNFLGVLEALAPVQAVIPVRRPDGEGVFVRPNGCVRCLPYDAVIATSGTITVDTTEATNNTTCPIPTAPIIRSIKGVNTAIPWVVRMMGPTYFSDANPREDIAPYLKDERGIGHSTVLILHRTIEGQPTSYVVAGCEGVETHSWGVDGWGGYASSLVNLGNGASVNRQKLLGFYICVEADLKLRLKWFDIADSSPGSTVADVRDELVTTLPKDKWVAILVRIGKPTEKTVVEVLDVYAGTKTRHEVREVMHIFTGRKFWSEQYGPTSRVGFAIHGEFDAKAAYNNPTSGRSVATFTTGPWARWNRKLSDAEVELLLTSIYDTTLSKVTRFVAEIYKHAPSMYVPMDEFPTSQPPMPTRRGLRAPVVWIGQKARPSPYLSGRRRMVNRQPKVFYIAPVPHKSQVTLLAFVYQSVSGGAGGLVTFGINARSPYELLSQWLYSALELSLEADGAFTVTYTPRDIGQLDNNAPTKVVSAPTPAKSVGYHMVALEFDLSASYTATFYVDGAKAYSARLTQGELYALQNASGSGASWLSTAVAVGHTPAYRYIYSQSVAPLCAEALGATVISPVVVTDMAAYAGCIGADAIKEIYDAWRIAVGDDSHA